MTVAPSGMKHPTPLPPPRRVALLLLVRAALAFTVSPIADATGLPPSAVAQLAAVALDAAAALASAKACDDAPRSRRGRRARR